MLRVATTYAFFCDWSGICGTLDDNFENEKYLSCKMFGVDIDWFSSFCHLPRDLHTTRLHSLRTFQAFWRSRGLLKHSLIVQGS